MAELKEEMEGGAIKLVETKEMSKATSTNKEIDEEVENDDYYKNANYDRISGATTNRFPGQERLQQNNNSTTRRTTTTAVGLQLNPETREENDEEEIEGDFEFAPAEVNLPLTKTTTITSTAESAAQSGEEFTETVRRSRRRRNNPHNHHAESARRTRLMEREEEKKTRAAGKLNQSI